jgi:hypothetical protein
MGRLIEEPADRVRSGSRRHSDRAPITSGLPPQADFFRVRHRLDQARPFICKRPPQFDDALNQSIVGDGQIQPHQGKELVIRNKTAGIFDEITQHREGLWPKGNLAPVRLAANIIT